MACHFSKHEFLACHVIVRSGCVPDNGPLGLCSGELFAWSAFRTIVRSGCVPDNCSLELCSEVCSLTRLA